MKVYVCFIYYHDNPRGAAKPHKAFSSEDGARQYCLEMNDRDGVEEYNYVDLEVE